MDTQNGLNAGRSRTVPRRPRSPASSVNRSGSPSRSGIVAAAGRRDCTASRLGPRVFYFDGSGLGGGALLLGLLLVASPVGHGALRGSFVGAGGARGGPCQSVEIDSRGGGEITIETEAARRQRLADARDESGAAGARCTRTGPRIRFPAHERRRAVDSASRPPGRPLRSEEG